MRVGWLHDDPGYLGGAELTMREFAAAAPDDVELVPCPAGDVLQGLDCYVVGNCMTYSRLPDGPIVRYHHDLARAPVDAGLEARHIFCSPLQRERMGLDGPCIPPALDLERFGRYASENHRKGAVCVGRMAYGKGLELLAEYPEPVDVYSSVPVASEGNARYKGATDDVAKTLSAYQRFVFLPTAIEPFGRAVVEAWAAGLELVVNRNVGALYWIRENPAGLDTAASDFWETVCST